MKFVYYKDCFFLLCVLVLLEKTIVCAIRTKEPKEYGKSEEIWNEPEIKSRDTWWDRNGGPAFYRIAGKPSMV